MAQTQERKQFVKINSTIDITVTPGLQYQDLSTPDAHIPDRLKVSPQWPKLSVLVMKGVHWYPSEIVDYPSVKSLEKSKILTVGEFADKIVDDVNLDKIVETKQRVTTEMAAQKKSLKDIVGD